MGILVAYGTAGTAPHYVTTANGAVPWGGTRVACLSSNDLLDIREFCEAEARCRGYEDERRGLSNLESETRLFHPDFLRGYPHASWTTFYAAGHMAYIQERQMEEFFARIRSE